MTWAKAFAKRMGGLIGLLVLASVFTPGLCAIACDLDLCPGCGMEQPEPTCCKDKAAKTKSCCETMAKVSASDDGKARYAQPFTVDVPILLTIPVLPSVDVPLVGHTPTSGHNERAPPAPDVGEHSPRGPPDLYA